MQTVPLVSLIVRTKDRPTLLTQALASINTQTYRPLEVVVINDGGDPPNQTLLASLLREVDLQLLNLASNRGRASAGNAGIYAAKGKYIGFLDDDDQLLPMHVSLLASCLENSEYKVCYSDAQICWKYFDPLRRHFAFKDCRLFSSRDFNFPDLLHENYIPLHCLLFEQETLHNSQGFDEQFELYEDWDLLLRIAAQHAFYHIPNITARYIQWDDRQQVGQSDAGKALRRPNHERLLAKHRSRFTIEVVHQNLHYRQQRDAAQTTIHKLEAQLEESTRNYKDLASQAQPLGENAEATLEQERIKQQGAELQQANQHIEYLQGQLDSIQGSRAWRLIQGYGRLRQLLSPWRYLRLGSRGLLPKMQRAVEITRTEGLNGLKRRLNRTLFIPDQVKTEEYPHVTLQEKNCNIEVVGPTLDISVSVIIPTLNAGTEFSHCLQAIREQWGLDQVELLVVDSGSNDQTVEIAKAAGATVIQIPPQSFQHAKTRNLAAQQAQGDFLVFTVQDAMPCGKTWLYRLLAPLIKEQAEAISVRSLPRTDADLFAKWTTWGYLHFLGLDQKGGALRNNLKDKGFVMMDPAQRRRHVILDNVCLGIRRSLFSQFEFRGAYGEDIDLGKRLLAAGHQLIFDTDNAVIHSHTRPAVYFFRRSFVDNIHLSRVLAIPRGTSHPEAILGSVARAYPAFGQCVEKWLADLTELERSPSDALLALVDQLQRSLHAQPNVSGPTEIDPELEQLFGRYKPSKAEDLLISNLEQYLCDALVDLSRYLQHHHDWVCSSEEIRSSLHKCYALSSGAFAALSGADLDAELQQGI